jgi:hypothetical protein
MGTHCRHCKVTYSSDELYTHDGLTNPRRAPVVFTISLPTLQMTYYADDGLIISGRIPVVTTLSLPTLQMI